MGASTADEKEGEGRGWDDLHDVSSFEGKNVLSYCVSKVRRLLLLLLLIFAGYAEMRWSRW